MEKCVTHVIQPNPTHNVNGLKLYVVTWIYFGMLKFLVWLELKYLALSYKIVIKLGNELKCAFGIDLKRQQRILPKSFSDLESWPRQTPRQ